MSHIVNLITLNGYSSCVGGVCVLVGLVCWSCVCFVSFFVPKNGGLILAQYCPLAHYCPSVVIA